MYTNTKTAHNRTTTTRAAINPEDVALLVKTAKHIGITEREAFRRAVEILATISGTIPITFSKEYLQSEGRLQA